MFKNYLIAGITFLFCVDIFADSTKKQLKMTEEFNVSECPIDVKCEIPGNYVISWTTDNLSTTQCNDVISSELINNYFISVKLENNSNKNLKFEIKNFNTFTEKHETVLNGNGALFIDYFLKKQTSVGFLYTERCFHAKTPSNAIITGSPQKASFTLKISSN